MASETLKSRFSVNRLITFFISSLFLCLTVFFFSPLEIVLNNIQEFQFPFSSVWGFQLLVSVLSAVLLTLILYLFPSRWGMLFAALIVAGGFAAWIQIMLLNGSMPVLTGVKKEIPRSQLIINLLIWLVVISVFLFVFFRLRKRKKIYSHYMLRLIGGLLIIMQSGAMISLAAGTDISGKPVSLHLSKEGIFDLTKGENVVVFVLDSVDQEYTDEMLAQYPEVKESLSGWTYYPNMTSVYSRTFPSLTYMLTGEKYYFDKDPADYVAEAFSNSGFLQTMKKQGTDIRIYTPRTEMLGDEGMKIVSNGAVIGNGRDPLDYYQLEKNFVRISLNRLMPYCLKGFFEYDINIINLSSFTFRPFREYLDPMFYEIFQENGGITVSESKQNTFKLYHLWSAHPGVFSWDTNLKFTDDWVRNDVLRGSFRFVEAYIDGLKKEGIYDQTFIIITADHGDSDGDRVHFGRNRAANPILMVKYPYSDLSKPLEENDSPVSHEDLFATVFNALSCSDGQTYGSGKALTDYNENDQRVRYHYYTTVDKKDHEVALVEYEINGDARDFANWRKTGKFWDILYSFNLMSDQKYTEQ